MNNFFDFSDALRNGAEAGGSAVIDSKIVSMSTTMLL